MLNEAERYLLQQVRAGDADGWMQLVDRFEGRLTAFAARQLSNRDDAQDIVQETFLSFIKALGANYKTSKTREEMNRAGLSPESISTVISHVRFLRPDTGTLQQRSKSIRARDIMHPVRESISENATLQEAIDLFGTWQTLSILVKRGTEVVGVLRTSELFQEMVARILSPQEDRTEGS